MPSSGSVSGYRTSMGSPTRMSGRSSRRGRTTPSATSATSCGAQPLHGTPAGRSGQRIIFVSLDDATGPIEITVFPSVQDKTARTVFHASAMAVWGQLRRTGKQGVSVIAEDVWDLVALHRARSDGRLRQEMALAVQPAAPHDGKQLWHASPGSAG